MIGVELVDTAAQPDDYGALPAASALAARVQQEALRRGLIVELGGRHSAVIRLLPPLTITDEQAEAVLDRLADALQAAQGAVQPTVGASRP
jgi:diaminobutyrate-2-oxoglutarate transaminase